MRCADGQARLAGHTEVGFKRLGDAAVGLGYAILEDTCPLVDAQQRYPCASTPCRNLADVVEQPFQPCVALLVVALVQFEDNAKVLRQFAQIPYVLLDIFGCAVVIVQQSEETVDYGMPGASESKPDGEYGMDDSIYKQMQLTGEEAPHRLRFARLLRGFPYRGRRRGHRRRGLSGRCGWEKGFEHVLAVLHRQWSAVESCSPMKSNLFAGTESGHCADWWK